MEEWLHEIAHHVALAIEAAAILIIAFGSAEALVRISPLVVKHVEGPGKRQIWMRYAQWLTAGLTFQLAADVVNTAVTPTWADIGHVAAIAAIRTFLTHFLDRDMETVRQRDEKKST